MVTKSSSSLGTDQSRSIQQMFDTLARGPKEVLPSRYWEHLNQKNIEQLTGDGYSNFKRTVALNYFTWIVHPSDQQIRRLVSRLPWFTTLGALVKTLLTPKHDLFNWRQSLSYTFLTLMTWAEVERQDTGGILKALSEPIEGNPPKILRKGRIVSQDLANSVLEYRSFMSLDEGQSEIKTVFELGAGYGRDAFVVLSLKPKIRYVIIDIPPALYIAQTYLTNQFADHKSFLFRDFKHYEEIRGEFESAQIAFLLPSQLSLLPDKSTDLFVNISSLHEMRLDQIEYYFGEINRLTRKMFYTKQWKVSNLPKEDIVIKESDYPIRSNWKPLFYRECSIQTQFFEAMYQID